MGVSGCTVAIKNQRWYGDKGAEGAEWFETLTQAHGTLTKDEWDKLRFGMVCSLPESFADIKAVEEKLCHQGNNCVYIVDPKGQLKAVPLDSFLDRATDFGKRAQDAKALSSE